MKHKEAEEFVWKMLEISAERAKLLRCYMQRALGRSIERTLPTRELLPLMRLLPSRVHSSSKKDLI